MPIDESIAGREFRAAEPYQVTEEAVRAFAEATRSTGARVPATFPIVVAFHAMAEFIVAGGLDLSRVVHGDEHFAYARPVRVGDVLDATLTVDNVRDVSGNGFYTTTTRITDDAGELVCTARATLVHRAAAGSPA